MKLIFETVTDNLTASGLELNERRCLDLGKNHINIFGTAIPEPLEPLNDENPPPGFILRILPGTVVVIERGDALYVYHNDGNPEQFLMCPNCSALWQKKVKRPTQCPYCHIRLDRKPLDLMELRYTEAEVLDKIKEQFPDLYRSWVTVADSIDD